MGLAGPGFVIGTAALALLLAAEVVASTAVTSEAALVYMAPRRNFLISLGMIGLQGLLSLGLCLIVRETGLPPIFYGVAVALALCLALGAASLVKARLLARLTRAGAWLATGNLLGDRRRGRPRLWRDSGARMGRTADRGAGDLGHLRLDHLDQRLRPRRPRIAADEAEVLKMQF